jgi:transcription antitermination factor NusG
MLKIADNPPVLYPEVDSLEDISGQWWVAHTKSRNEKAFAWNLARMNIPYFLPMREKLAMRRGKKYRSLLPLFSGYVFFSGDEEIRYKSLATNRLAQVIEVVDQVKFLRDLCQIKRAMDRKATLDPHPYLKTGKLCRVVAGALVGIEGKILRKNKKTKLLLQVDMLGQAAAVEIDADLLEPIN